MKNEKESKESPKYYWRERLPERQERERKETMTK